MPYIYFQRLYKKNAQEGFGKFTLVVDRPEIVLAKINATNLSDVCQHATLKLLLFKNHISNLIAPLKAMPCYFPSPIAEVQRDVQCRKGSLHRFRRHSSTGPQQRGVKEHQRGKHLNCSFIFM